MRKYFIYDETLRSDNYIEADRIPDDFIPDDKIEKYIEQVTDYKGRWHTLWNGSRYYSADDFEIFENDIEDEATYGYILKDRNGFETAFVPVAVVEYDEDEDDSSLEIIGYLSTGVVEGRKGAVVLTNVSEPETAKVTGSIKSNKGFYVGDLCYALNDDVYDTIWGGAAYQDGIYKEPVTGRCFAVAATADGDGTYIDNNRRTYDVDAGNISLVPGELAEDTFGGHFFPGAGTASFEAENGVFMITLPSGETIRINTRF